MSGKGDDEEYRVGYKRPPRNTQFPPGKSGNRKGRRRQPRRVPSPSQVGRDVLRVREFPVPIKTPEGEKTLTLGEAIIYSIGKRALSDKVSYAKMWLALEKEALEQQYQSYSQVRLAELLRKIIDEIAPDRDKLTEEALDALIKKWRKIH